MQDVCAPTPSGTYRYQFMWRLANTSGGTLLAPQNVISGLRSTWVNLTLSAPVNVSVCLLTHVASHHPRLHTHTHTLVRSADDSATEFLAP